MASPSPSPVMQGRDGRTRLQRLSSSVEWSRLQMESFRRTRRMFVSDFVGKHFGDLTDLRRTSRRNWDDQNRDKNPINLLAQAVLIYQRALAARRPQVLVTTKVPEIKVAARQSEIAMNHLLDEINFEKIFRRSVLNALFYTGVLKTGINIFDEEMRPYCAHVSMDDLIFDMTANAPEAMSYIGNIYSVPYDFVMESDLFNKEARDNLSPSPLKSENPSQEGSDTRTSMLQSGSGDLETRGQWRDMIELMDVYIPGQNILLTLPYQQEIKNGHPLREVDWAGPTRRHGPYHVLSLIEVPDQAMGMGPASLWYDLHDLANRLFRKLGRQAERQKTITAYAAESATDAKRVTEADDGDTLRVQDPNRVRELNYGGVDGRNLAFTLQLRDIFSVMAGNLESLGGLGAQTSTVGQEQLISESANKQLADMQAETVRFAKEVITDLSWYEWTDPVRVRLMEYKVPGFDTPIPVYFTPEEKDFDFHELNIEIDPYSMRVQSPAEKLQNMTNLVGMVAQFPQQMAEQGVSLSMEGLIRLYAKYTQMDELSDLITFSQPQSGAHLQEGANQVNPKPPPPARHYVRESRSVQSPKGQQNALVASLLGRDLQESEGKRMFGVSGGG